ncbi:MAG TPA: hypothetical protein VF529_12845 [Solirubrobacteraceae bacterium]
MKVRTSAACCLALLGIAAPAAADEPRGVEPAPGASFARGSLPWFAVEAPGAERVGFVVASDRAGAESLIGDVADGIDGAAGADGTFGWRLPASSLAAIRPGRYWWLAVAWRPDGTVGRTRAVAFDVRLPRGAERRGPIPRRFGRRGKGAFAISVHGIPRDVALARLWTLAARSAERWGLRAAGWTRFRPRRDDGYNVLGFGRLPRDTAGVTRTRVVRRYRRTLRCLAGHCVEIARRYVGTVVVERDIVLNDRLRWELGPAYPWLDETDLESVLIHELGHFAGNGHVGSCSGSPMAGSHRPGDWWRSPLDRFALDCTRVRG